MKRLGCFGMIVIVLLGVIAYQQWRISQLDAQLASAASKAGSGQGSKAAAKNADLAGALAEAQAYTRRAQEFLSSRNLKQAQADLDKAKQKLDAAGKFSKGIYDNSSEFLGKAKTRTADVFHKAWNDITEKPKGETEKQKSNNKE